MINCAHIYNMIANEIDQCWIDGIQGQNVTQGYFGNFTLLSHESIMEDQISCNDYISGLLV